MATFYANEVATITSIRKALKQICPPESGGSRPSSSSPQRLSALDFTEARSLVSTEVSAARSRAATSLSHTSVLELLGLLEVPAAKRDAVRCAELCRPLHFFKRLAPEQCKALLQVGTLVRVQAADFVEREGDPAGFTYVVLTGAIAIHARCDDLGGCHAFVRSVFDGKAFGDGWDATDSRHFGAGRRAVAAIAQEDSALLRIATADYKAVLTGESSGAAASSLAAVQKLDFLADCDVHLLSILAQLMEPRVMGYGESVVVPGHRPRVLFLLTKGYCAVCVNAFRASNEKDQELTITTLYSGASFGHGALLDPLKPCPYVAKAGIVVQSSVAEFQLLSPKSLFQLPDSTLARIRERLVDAEDPIRQTGAAARARDARWQRERRRTLVALGHVPCQKPAASAPTRLLRRSRSTTC